MIVCGSCGKDNADLYKFCLTCGNDLTVAPPLSSTSSARTVMAEAPPSTAPAKRSTPGTAPPVFAEMGPLEGTDPAMTMPSEPTQSKWPGGNGETPAPAIAPSDEEDEVDEAVVPRTCGACGNLVPPGFAFCANCGARVNVSASRAAVPSQAAVAGRMVLVRPDGSEGGTHGLVEGENRIGRGAGPLFEADGYLSPKHAELVLNAAGVVVRDCGSLNGVFVKIPGEEELLDGDVFRIGQELLRFQAIPPPEPLEDGTEILGSPNPGFWGRLAVIVGRDQEGSAFPMFGEATILGRERGDILFPEDGYVSGTHARVSYRDGRYWIGDLNSSNGTFLRIRGDRIVPAGSFILMGQQLFRVDYP